MLTLPPVVSAGTALSVFSVPSFPVYVFFYPYLLYIVVPFMADPNQSELCSANWHCSKILFCVSLLCPSFHWPTPNIKSRRCLLSSWHLGNSGWDSLPALRRQSLSSVLVSVYGLCTGLLLRTSVDWDSGMAVKINVDWAKNLTENLTWASRRSSMLSLVCEFWASVTGLLWSSDPDQSGCAYCQYSHILWFLWLSHPDTVVWTANTMGEVRLTQRSSGMIICKCPPFIRLSLFADILKVIHFIVRDVALEDAKILLSLCWV